MTNSAIVAGTLRVPSHVSRTIETVARLLRARCRVTAHGVCLLLWTVSAFAVPAVARADRLDEIKKRGTLIWGADAAGGAPYVQDEKGVQTGFEVEIADELAKELGVKALFYQGDWDQLPPLMEKGEIDIVLNGYESTRERQDAYGCSRPYYRYGLQLLVRRDSPIQSWNDLLKLKEGNGDFKIAVLNDSAAEKYVIEKFGEERHQSFKNALDAMTKTEQREDVATLQDDCFANYFAKEYPELRFVEKPTAPGYYVALVNKKEDRLLQAVNATLEKMIHDGRLAKIYDHWKMGGPDQVAMLYETNENKGDGSTTGNNWQYVWENMPLLLKAAGVTIELAVIAMPLAIIIGILVAIGRMYGPWFIAKPLTVYVEVLRGTPLMLQLYFLYFLLPNLGIELSFMQAAILGLAINYSGYEAEIYRAGFQAVSPGQMEAALSLGMTKRQAIWHVVLPQAFRIVIPPVANDFIALFKDTSVCSVISVIELTKRYDILRQNHPTALVHLAAVIAGLYLLMSYPASLFARWTEKKLGGRKIDGAHGQAPA